jgi:uncharacterized protein with PQ loop repeat
MSDEILPACFTYPSKTNLTVAGILVAGTLISYIPQYLAIIRVGSSSGLNYGMLGIALFSAFLTCINSGILKWYDIVCCGEEGMTLAKCLENNLATLQLLNSLICYLILYILFLVYWNITPTETETRKFRIMVRNRAWMLFILIILASLFLSFLGGILFYKFHLTSDTLVKYAMTLGTISSILMIVQWAPQIYTTWRIKSQGSLSLLMLIMQLPGALLVIIFQGVLNNASITTWGPYIFGALEMTILIVMCIYYKLRKQRRESTYEETDALLRDFRP